MDDKALEKSAEKSAQKSIKELIPTSTIAILALFAAIAFAVVNLHPPNESWFSGIATALITVDGIILGFSILGVTVVAERGFSASRMTPIFRKHFRDFVENLKVVEISDAQKTEEKIESAIVSALIDIFTVPHLLFVAMGLVFASLVSALMLFGFSDSMANSYPIVANVFQSVLSFSIFTLVLGFYMTIRVLQDLTTKMEPQKIAKALGKALENIEQDLKKATAKKE